jgi:hypothetical protein
MDRKVLIGISIVVVLFAELCAAVAFIIGPSLDGHSSTHRYDVAGIPMTRKFANAPAFIRGGDTVPRAVDASGPRSAVAAGSSIPLGHPAPALAQRVHGGAQKLAAIAGGAAGRCA